MPTGLEIALDLAARGFPVFPCSLPKKRPAIPKTMGGSGFKQATVDASAICAMWDIVPTAPIVGVPTGSLSGFDVLDIDYRNGGTEWETDNAHRLPETRVHQTMNGGRHYVFRHAPGVRNSASKQTLAPGIDVRGDGGYVIMPPSPGYSVVSDASPAEWPDWLLQLILTRPMGERPSPTPKVEIDSKRLAGLQKSILDRVGAAAEGQKHTALRNAALSLGGIIQAAGISQDQAVRMLISALPSTVEDWKLAEETARWGVEHGARAPLELEDRPEYQTRHINGHDQPPPANGQATEPPSNVVKLMPPARAAPDWRAEWHRTETGAPLPNLFNAVHALREAPELTGKVRYNEMLRRDVIQERTIWRGIEDRHVIAMQHELQILGLRRLSRETVQDAVTMVAVERSYHPVRDYLDRLKWDGEDRCAGWLSRYLGVEGSQYADEIGRLFLVSMVARIYEPGCQADYVLVLEGEQGKFKSTACRVLAGEWFSDSLPDLKHSDAVRLSMHLRGKWLIEIAELSSFNASETETIKAFATRTHEDYTPKYGHNDVNEPRQCVFIATTNQQTYLHDETGARRFWPVRVGIIDIQSLTSDRDQLFAEAVFLYKSGAKRHPDREFEKLHIAPQQAERFDEDPWKGTIVEWLSAQYDRGFTITEICNGALSMEVQRVGTQVQRRVRKILVQGGWHQRRSHNQGRRWVRASSEDG